MFHQHDFVTAVAREVKTETKLSDTENRYTVCYDHVVYCRKCGTYLEDIN